MGKTLHIIPSGIIWPLIVEKWIGDEPDKANHEVIQYPVPTFKSEAEIPTDLERIEFKLTVPATMEYIPLIFTTYAEQATLTTDAEWLTLPDTIFSPGTHSFQPAIPANKTKDMRTATLKLRSGELENEIHITQSAAEQ